MAIIPYQSGSDYQRLRGLRDQIRAPIDRRRPEEAVRDWDHKRRTSTVSLSTRSGAAEDTPNRYYWLADGHLAVGGIWSYSAWSEFGTPHIRN